jgi:hypothetical protein
MVSNIMCPVSDKKVNERVARVNATFTVLILVIFIFTHNVFLLAFLAVDFFIRASAFSKYSLIGISSRTLVRYFAVREYFINAGPKILAARIGLILCSLMIVTFILKASWVVYFLAGLLGLFSTLEAVFGFCVACRIYPYLYRFLYNEKYN